MRPVEGAIDGMGAPSLDCRHRRCQGLRYLRVDRGLTQLVAARWLAPLLGGDLDREGGQQQLVDVERGPVLRADREDGGLLGRRPCGMRLFLPTLDH
jgi:hypothetical protein